MGQSSPRETTDSATAEPVGVTRRTADGDETAQANRRWWDAGAAGYQAEHGDFLGDAGFLSSTLGS